MKSHCGNQRTHAFTVFEVLIVLAVLMLLAALLLPSLAKSHRGPSRISCVYNLKQVGLSYRIWAGDNGDQFPMSVSTNQGGSMELVQAGDVVSTFRVMSNELSTPRILVCPNDFKREAATNFSTGLRNANISYFVGIDAVETNVMTFLSGDRNITNVTRLRAGLFELTTNRPSGWTEEIHQKVGNLGFADGSVQQVTTPGLRDAIANTGFATNRLAIP